MKSRKAKVGNIPLVAVFVAAPALLFLLFLCILHFYEPAHSWLGGKGIAIDRLAQLGESFGSLTVVYAAFAAAGAWLSYRAQREQLEQERSHRRQTRFDEAFFRLLDFYDAELAKIHTGFVYTHGGGGRPTSQLGQTAEGKYIISKLRSDVEKKTSASLEKGEPASLQWNLRQIYRSGSFRTVESLGNQIVAIVSWLQDESYGVAVRRRGALLAPRLSDDELWLWGLSIAHTSDPGLMQFAQRLGIVGEGGGPPNNIGTGRVFTEYTLTQDMNAFYAMADSPAAQHS